MSKRISVQWRITILTALLIAAACVSLNLLLFYSGSGSMDALNGFVVEYKTENQQEMTIQIPKENMQAFFSDFSQQVNEEKVRFERIGWYITPADRTDPRRKPAGPPSAGGYDCRVPAAERVSERHAGPAGAVVRCTAAVYGQRRP